MVQKCPRPVFFLHKELQLKQNLFVEETWKIHNCATNWSGIFVFPTVTAYLVYRNFSEYIDILRETIVKFISLTVSINETFEFSEFSLFSSKCKSNVPHVLNFLQYLMVCNYKSTLNHSFSAFINSSLFLTNNFKNCAHFNKLGSAVHNVYDFELCEIDVRAFELRKRFDYF